MDSSKIAKAEAAADKARIKAMRPWYQKKRFILPIGFFALIVISSALNPNTSTPVPTPASETSVKPSVENSPSPSELVPTQSESGDEAPSTEPQSNETVSQKNARMKASDYLDYTSFSRTGLIEQLEFEGFTLDDSTYGVDSLNVDWMNQAALKAKDYLEYTSFSRQGLIEQLLFEGFSAEEAEYGVSTTGL
jgi:hypothetical protein